MSYGRSYEGGDSWYGGGPPSLTTSSDRDVWGPGSGAGRADAWGPSRSQGWDAPQQTQKTPPPQTSAPDPWGQAPGGGGGSSGWPLQQRSGPPGDDRRRSDRFGDDARPAEYNRPPPQQQAWERSPPRGRNEHIDPRNDPPVDGYGRHTGPASERDRPYQGGPPDRSDRPPWERERERDHDWDEKGKGKGGGWGGKKGDKGWPDDDWGPGPGKGSKGRYSSDWDHWDARGEDRWGEGKGRKGWDDGPRGKDGWGKGDKGDYGGKGDWEYEGRKGDYKGDRKGDYGGKGDYDRKGDYGDRKGDYGRDYEGRKGDYGFGKGSNRADARESRYNDDYDDHRDRRPPPPRQWDRAGGGGPRSYDDDDRRGKGKGPVKPSGAWWDDDQLPERRQRRTPPRNRDRDRDRDGGRKGQSGRGEVRGGWVNAPSGGGGGYNDRDGKGKGKGQAAGAKNAAATKAGDVTVEVRGLPDSWTWRDVKRMLLQFGEANDVRQRQRGAFFTAHMKQQGAKAAIKVLDDTIPKGCEKRIQVAIAEKKEDRPGEGKGEGKGDRRKEDKFVKDPQAEREQAVKLALAVNPQVLRAVLSTPESKRRGMDVQALTFAYNRCIDPKKRVFDRRPKPGYSGVVLSALEAVGECALWERGPDRYVITLAEEQLPYPAQLYLRPRTKEYPKTLQPQIADEVEHARAHAEEPQKPKTLPAKPYPGNLYSPPS